MGLNIEKEKCDIIILAGQSNAEGYGRGNVRNAYKPSSDILALSDVQGIDFKKDQNNGDDYLAVKYPSEYVVDIAKETKTKTGKLGNIALIFAREYIKAGKLEKGRKILIVKAAVGGTGFSKHHWGVDEVLYKRLVDMVSQALGYNKENRIVAFLWHQGEHDSFENADLSPDTRKAFYYDKLSNFLKSLRKKFGEFPFIAGGFVHTWYDAYKEQSDAVLNATKKVCKENKKCAFVSAKGLLSNSDIFKNDDTAHFCRNSAYKLAKRYFKQYNTL